MSGKIADIKGQKFNMLTAIEFVGTRMSKDNRKEALWLWKCDCGKEFEYLAKFIKYNTKNQKVSCGCWFPVKKNFGVRARANHVFLRNYADGNLDLQQFIDLSQLDCHYCHAKPSNKSVKKNHIFTYNGLDRLDNNQPHNLNNVVPCCWICNERKGNWSYQTFIDWIKKVNAIHG